MIKFTGTLLFTYLNLSNTKLLKFLTNTFNFSVLFLLTVSISSLADTLVDWDVKNGSITFIEDDLPENHWFSAQTQLLLVDDTMSFVFYLLPTNELEKCMFGLNNQSKDTALVINDEVIDAQVSCHQKIDGTHYAINISSPAYFERVLETFKSSSNVKIKHDIVTFKASAMGFTNVWDMKSKEYQLPTLIDYLIPQRLAAKSGDVASQFFLGFCHVTGKAPCPLDYHVAFKWMEMAAHQNDAGAQFTLAKMYANGNGVIKDLKKSLKWLRKAAEQNQAAAQFHLGVHYLRGDGVIKNDVIAHMWFNISAANGYDKAREPLELMQKYLSQNELENAYNLARKCLKNNIKNC